MSITTEPFGKNPYGECVERFTLTNGNGIKLCIMTHGATILSLETPDRDGALADIALGFETAAEYGPGTPYFGSTIGRVANRISFGKFSMNGKEFQLALNGDGIHSLHGGDRGFDKRIWVAEALATENGVRMSYTSPDGEEGYPGTLTATITYTLTEENEVKLDYAAETDQPTPVNLTNHSYFNLAGHDAGEICEHLLTINADRFIPTDGTGKPHGELRCVGGTPMDFRTPHAIGERINADYESIQCLKSPGYDHNYCLNQTSENKLTFAARAEDVASGRTMEIFTTEPGVQFYSGNFLDGTDRGKGGYQYALRGGFCLETQRYPDSPNQPQFTDITLRPGETFRSQTIYKFDARSRIPQR